MVDKIRCVCGEEIPFGSFNCHHCGRESFVEIDSSDKLETSRVEECELGDQIFEP